MDEGRLEPDKGQSEEELLAQRMADLCGFPMRSDWIAATAASVRQFIAAARLVVDFPLADDIEAAPRFEA